MKNPMVEIAEIKDVIRAIKADPKHALKDSLKKYQRTLMLYYRSMFFNN